MPAHLEYEENTSELTDGCRQRLNLIVAVAIGRGVSSISIAHPGLDADSQAQAEAVKAYLETQYASRVAIEVIDVGVLGRRSRVKDVELWMQEPLNSGPSYQVSDL